MEKIIVGMDQSDSAAAALRWAVREGGHRGWPVMAMLAWGHLDHHFTGSVTDDVAKAYDDQIARHVLASAVTNALGTFAAAAVETTVVQATPAEALVGASAEAALLVVGARGLGGFKSLLLGSVGNECVHRAECPVVVVRAEANQLPHDPQRIVVGIDGTDAAHAALEWALRAARARGTATEVEVVHAWRSATLPTPVAPVVMDWTAFEEAAHQTLDSVVDATDCGDVVVRRSLVFGAPAQAILEAADQADLVVVSSRGRSTVKGMLLGSVSQQVIHHALCPVVVVPPHPHHR